MKTLGGFLILAVLGLGATAAVAGDECCGGPNCCAHCGGHVACHPKACELQCGVKKEKKHYWCVECDEFCTLLPSCRDRCCGNCDEACRGDCCGRCCKRYVTPKCGRPKCVKKLVKKEYEVEVPTYKCTVVYLCCDCRDQQSEPAAEPAAPMAPLPAPPSPKPAPPAAP